MTDNLMYLVVELISILQEYTLAVNIAIKGRRKTNQCWIYLFNQAVSATLHVGQSMETVKYDPSGSSSFEEEQNKRHTAVGVHSTD